MGLDLEKTAAVAAAGAFYPPPWVEECVTGWQCDFANCDASPVRVKLGTTFICEWLIRRLNSERGSLFRT